MGIGSFIILVGSCLVGSAVSVVAGFGGGLLFFAAMAAVLDFALVIPLHGTIGASANIFRISLFWKHIDRSASKSFLVTFLPCALLSTVAWYFLIETEAAQPYIKMAIAVCLIVFTLMPNFEIKSKNRFKVMAGAGVATGLPVMLFNVGPLLVPFLVALDLKKDSFIGTFAFIGLIITLSKIPLFLFILDRLSWEIGLLIVLMIAAVGIGTYAGKAISGQVSENLFRALVKIILIAISLKLLLWDGVRVLAGWH